MKEKRGERGGVERKTEIDERKLKRMEGEKERRKRKGRMGERENF